MVEEAHSGASSLSAALIRAQQKGEVLDADALWRPASLAEAERVQLEVTAGLGSTVAGWKVGFAPEPDTLATAPIYKNLLLGEGARYSGGAASFLAIEVEIAFRIAEDMNGAADETKLGQAFVGIEIVRSRLRQGPKVPFPLFVADNIASGAYVTGPQRSDWRDLDLSHLRCRVWKDGELVRDVKGGHPQGDPRVPFHALNDRPVQRLGGIRKGQFVTTGTLCGILQVDRPCSVRAELEKFGTVGVDLVA